MALLIVAGFEQAVEQEIIAELKQLGYNTMRSQTFEQTMTLAEKNQVDLIITNLNERPGAMNGFSLGKEVPKVSPSTKIIAANESSCDDNTVIGIDEFIKISTKFIDDLLTKVKELLGES